MNDNIYILPSVIISIDKNGKQENINMSFNTAKMSIKIGCCNKSVYQYKNVCLGPHEVSAIQ